MPDTDRLPCTWWTAPFTCITTAPPELVRSRQVCGTCYDVLTGGTAHAN